MSKQIGQTNKLPRHVAVIMDGNGRWAQARGKKRIFGHQKGVERVREAVESCQRLGIEALTLFAFSSENWRRPPEEVSFLMQLFLKALTKELNALHKNNVRIRFIGDRSPFSDSLKQVMHDAEHKTKGNTGIQLTVAVNYGGQWDIVNAAKQLAQEVASKHIQVDEIDREHFASKLSTYGLPAVDLLIRTGGEQRISNFLLWDSAYAELYFTSTLWPDFDAEAWRQALDDYARRERRFGGLSSTMKFS